MRASSLSLLLSFAVMGSELWAAAKVVKLPGPIKMAQIWLEGAQVARKQNFSGATRVDGRVMVIDDAGFHMPSLFYTMDENSLGSASPWKLNLPANFIDLEGITYSDGDFILATSLTNNEPESWSSQWLARFRTDQNCQCVVEFQTIPFRKPIVDSFYKKYPKAWTDRIVVADAKFGGLNLEGLANAEESPHTLILGFRSPLLGDAFGYEKDGKALALNRGLAILAEVQNPFSGQPKIELRELDLEGMGIRSMEYLPKLKKYGILAGQADIGDHYALWLWDRQKNELEKVDLPELKQMCRPESIVQIGEGKTSRILILSENSGVICNRSEYDSLTIGI